MSLCTAFVLYLLVGTCFSTSVFAAAVVEVGPNGAIDPITGEVSATGETNYVQSNGINFDLEVSGSITTQKGSGIYLNGISPMRDVVITNTGTIAVSGQGYGQGWGVYANVYQGRPVTATITNNGTLERVQLQETVNSSIVNNTGATVSGSVLLGANGIISNYGAFARKDDDVGVNNVANLISFESGGLLNNGLLLDGDEETGVVSGASFFKDATITTDHIRFVYDGIINNSGQIDNKSITMLDRGSIYNMADPYNTSNAGTTDSDGPKLTTEKLVMGNAALIRGDQGTNMDIGSMVLGDDAELTFGDDYLLQYEQKVTVSTSTESGDETSEESEEKISNQVPKIATVNITTGQLGANGKLNLLNGAQYTGQTLSFGSGGTVTTSGGTITMTAETAENTVTPILSFADNGTVNLSSYYRDAVTIDEITADSDTEDGSVTETTVEAELQKSTLTTDILSFANNGVIQLEGAGITAGSIIFDDYGTLSGNYYTYSEMTDTETDDTDTATVAETTTTTPTAQQTAIRDFLQNIAGFDTLETAEQDAFVDSVVTAVTGGDATLATQKITTLLQNNLYGFSSLTQEEQSQTVSSVLTTLKALADNTDTSTGSGSESGTGTVDSLDGSVQVSSAVIATDSIRFNDYGTITAGQGLTITAPLVSFNNNGTVTNYGDFNVNKLIMGDFSTINTYGEMTSDVTVGSHSRAYLLSAAEEGLTENTCTGFGQCKGGSIIGGFQKANGATDVEIVSATDYGYYGYLANRINVDKITVQQNMLNLNNVEANGRIEIGTDAWLRLSGAKANIYDPITRVDGATNTTMEILLDDEVFFTTRNTVEADHVLVSGGGFEITRPISVGDITLDSNTVVRVTGNFAVGELVEKNGNAVNTTFDIRVGDGNILNSSGDIELDRVVVESGTFNAYHDVIALNDSEKFSEIDGVELGTNTTMNVYGSAEVGRIARQQDASGTVQNTTMTLQGGDLTVHKNGDVDTLTLDKGRFVFLNEQGINAMNITNDLYVGSGSVLAGSGALNVKSGTVTVDRGAHLGVSVQSVAEQALADLVITSQASTITDTTGKVRTDSADVTLNSGAFLDVRASGADNDVVDVDGISTLNNGTRLIVRNPELNTTYTVARAGTLNALADDIIHSFLWKDTIVSTNNNQLSVQIGDIQTLAEGIAPVEHSKNVDEIAIALTDIRNQVGHYAIADFLDNVFYADMASSAVAIMNEYVPDGYLNAQTAAVRTMQGFRQNAMDALDNLRVAPTQERRFTRTGGAYQSGQRVPTVQAVRRVTPRRAVPDRGGFHYTSTVYNPSGQGGYNGQVMYQNAYTPVYYGRGGGDSYRTYTTRRPQFNKRKKVRTDRGGLWMNPFVSRVTQDAKDGFAGYDYDSYGLTVGADRKFGSLALGITGMVAEGELKQNTFKSDVTSYGVGVYGSYQPRSSARFIDFYALWATNAHKGERRIDSLAEKLKADYDVTALSGGTSIGYNWALSPNVTITPRIGLDYTRVTSDDIKENGDSPLLIDMTVEDFTSIKAPLELKAAMRLGNVYNQLLPEAHIRWTHEFGDTAPQGRANFVNYQVPFGVSGLEADKDTFTLGGSVAWLTGASELSLHYDYEFGSSLSGHTLNAGYKYAF